MNDFDYDALQKKRIAAGARHMKRGSRSKRCSLPSDNLTPAQLKRRNGPVLTYNLNAPMDWGTYKLLTLDMKKQYLSNLIEHRIPNSWIADLFRVSEATVSAERKRLGCKRLPPRLSNEERDQRWDWFSEFCDQNEVGKACFAKYRGPSKPEHVPPKSQAKQCIANPMDLYGVSAVFTGDLNLESITQWMQKLPIPETDKVMITLRVERLENAGQTGR